MMKFYIVQWVMEFNLHLYNNRNEELCLYWSNRISSELDYISK
jgi:hypothetical protein